MGHSIFGWDLPPGVRVSDIPGNRPEDEAWEKIEQEFWNGKHVSDVIWNKFEKAKLDSDLMDVVNDAIMFGMELGKKEQQETERENKYYESQYHERVRNPKLRAFFKAQRERIRGNNEN